MLRQTEMYMLATPQMMQIEVAHQLSVRYDVSAIDDDDVTPSLPTFKTYVSNLMELNMLIKLLQYLWFFFFLLANQFE